MLKWIFIVLGFVLVMTLVGVWWRVSSSCESLLMNFYGESLTTFP